MNKTKRTEIFTRLRNENPTPTTELKYASTFELLIAVMLSAQATDVSVNKATEKLFPVANSPEAIVALGESKVRNYIKTIGLFNTKAANVIKTCSMICMFVSEKNTINSFTITAYHLLTKVRTAINYISMRIKINFN